MKRSLLYLLCGGVLAFSSCTKELDQDPTGVFGPDVAFQNISHVQLGLNGAYGRYGAYANDMYVNALLSDEAKLGAGNAGQGALTYRLQFSADGTSGGDVTAAYYAYYSLIDQVNRVLPHVATVTATPGEEARRPIITGQLLALRALGHFSLLQMYSDRYDPAKPGVPLMLESCLLCKPARNTMGEVMAQIEKDLTDAKGMLPAVTTGNFSDTVLNQLNITAFQARIALYKKDYQAAIDHATTVINSPIKPLVSGAAFSGIWTDANTNEILFRIRYATSSAIGSLWTTTGGDIYIAPSDKLVSSFGTDDIRKDAYIGSDVFGNNYVKKFYTSSKGGRVVDMKVIRKAEMYLIRAEAYARLATPNIAAATADLNTLRAARITGYTNVTFGSVTELLDAIMEERFKELAFEGHRWYDLKRNSMPLQRNSSDANAAWATLPVDDYRWLLPIPRQEIIVNPNTTQNTGYN